MWIELTQGRLFNGIVLWTWHWCSGSHTDRFLDELNNCHLLKKVIIQCNLVSWLLDNRSLKTGHIELLILCSALFYADLLSAKLPSVPEEYIPDDMFRGRNVGLDVLAIQQEATVPQTQMSQPQAVVQQPMEQTPTDSPLQYTATIFAQPETDASFRTFGPGSLHQGTYIIKMTETFLYVNSLGSLTNNIDSQYVFFRICWTDWYCKIRHHTYVRGICFKFHLSYWPSWFLVVFLQFCQVWIAHVKWPRRAFFTSLTSFMILFPSHLLLCNLFDWKP